MTDDDERDPDAETPDEKPAAADARPGPAELVPDDADEVLRRVLGPAAEAPGGEHRSGFVALVGRPNVGKSTITNALVGEKVAITTPRPQTTRRRVVGIRTTPEAQVVFVDTPGFHRPRHELGRAMVRAARAAIPEADVVVMIVDAGVPPTGLDRSVAANVRDGGRAAILVLNKADKLPAALLEERVAAYRALLEDTERWLPTIATRRHNLDKLWTMIVALLPEGPPLYPEDAYTDQSERELVAELVRESALLALREEVPHGIEVVVEAWEEREDGLLMIGARVVVEQERHKGIVIGKGGRMLKTIGSRARPKIESLLGRKVYLELFVSARPDWRKRPSDLRRLGY